MSSPKDNLIATETLYGDSVRDRAFYEDRGL